MEISRSVFFWGMTMWLAVWPPPKFTAAGSLSIFIQALIHFHDLVVSAGNPRTRATLSGTPLCQRCQVRPERRSVTGLNLTFIVQGPVFPTVLLIRTSKAGCKPALRPPNRQKYVYLFHSCDSWASPQSPKPDFLRFLLFKIDLFFVSSEYSVV